MKAKDTIIKDFKYAQAKYMGDGFLEILKEQAEVSFIAGMKEVVDWIVSESKHHIVYKSTNPTEKSYPVGYELLILEQQWRLKLKEWGME